MEEVASEPRSSGRSQGKEICKQLTGIQVCVNELTPSFPGVVGYSP